MAYLAATRLNEYRANYAKSKLDAYEHRVSRYGAFEAFKADTPNLLSNSQEIIDGKSDGNRAVKIPVINRKSYTIGSTRTCNAQTNSNESALVTVTYVTLTAGFHMIPSQYKGNEIGYQADFNRKMDDVQRDLLAHIDTLAITKLDTIKSAVNAAEGNPWDFTGDVVQIGADETDTMFGELESMMASNDLYNPLHVVTSPRLLALVRHNQAQGPSNDENLGYQFGGINFRSTNRCTVSDGARDSFFVYPTGSLAFLNWNDVDSQMGHKSTSGKEWSEQYLPMLGLKMGMMFQSDCADNTTEAGSGNGFEASLKESYFFNTDVAFVSAYNSDTATYAGTVFKADVLKA